MISLKGETCWDTRTLLFHVVLIENIDLFILAARLPIFGVVSSVVLQEGKINTLFILQR